jgi:hypothetical protein
MGKFNRLIVEAWRGGLYSGGILISIGISLAISAISYGIQALLAPKPPPIVGPRLDDLGPPVSNPGRPIPNAKGRNQVNGQVIWATGLVETRHTEKVKGGKGLSKTQKIRTYTYSQSLAVAVNDGEISCFKRILGNAAKTIWSENNLVKLSGSEIDDLVAAEYTRVFDEQEAVWLAVIDPDTGLAKYTAAEADALADANATNAAQALRDDLEAGNAEVQPRYSSIEFYYGTEDQDPSPIIEGYEGVGNVSAFRGMAYFVISDLELADFGNLAPSFLVDYVAGGVVTDSFEKTTGTDTAPKYADDRKAFVDWDAGKVWLTEEDENNEDSFIHEYNLTTQEYVQEISLSAAIYGVTFFMGIDRETGYLYGWDADVSDFYWQVFDPGAGTYVTDAVWGGNQSTELFATGENHWVVITSPNDLEKVIFQHDPGVMDSADLALFHDAANGAFNSRFARAAGFATGTQPVGGDKGEGFVVVWSTTEARIMQYALSDLGVVTETIVGTITPADIGVAAFYTSIFSNPECHYSPGTRTIHFYITTTETPRKYWVGYDIDAASVIYSVQLSVPDGFGSITRMQTNLTSGSSLTLLSDDGTEFWTINLASGSVTTTDTNAANLNLDDRMFWDERFGCMYGYTVDTVSGFQRLDKYCWDSTCDSETSLTQIITHFMTRSGYAASEYEIDAALDAELIWGFSDNSGRSTRDMLEDLARIRPLIVNEIEGKIRFRLADQAISATIPKEDVRAYDGSGEPPAWITEVQTFEDLSLPKTLRITYQDINRALNPVTAIFTREITQSTTVEEFAVQAVDNSARMRNSVFVGMSVLMTGKRTFKLTVPLKYSVLEPGDVITIPVSETRTAKARVAQATLGANNIIELECALFIDTSLDITHTEQFPVATSTDTAVGVPPTNVFLLDIPYLTDNFEPTAADDTVEDNGIYVAFVTTLTQWPGAILYVDQQTLTTEESFGIITQPTGAPDWQVIADTPSVTFAGLIALLPDPAASALVQDIVSELVVSFYTPFTTFETIASGSELSTLDNAFLVGNEIIQAQTVELLNTDANGLKTYAFTNLWRGLQGTEWAIGTQSVGDQVLHLDIGTLQRVDLENPDLIGLTVDFKAVTVGSDIVSTDTTSLVYDAASRKPWAPGIEAVVRDDAGNLTFELIQRNRYGSLWTPTSPPFESDPDDFEVDILLGGSPATLRTITVSGTATISYTAAQQTTDFGAPQASIAVAAYQLNDDGRRGFAREETI